MQRTSSHDGARDSDGDTRPPSQRSIRQLALPFAHRPRFERADFLAAESNADALAWLSAPGHADWPQRRLALWGEEGSGKTHLLHVWAAEHQALLLPGTALRDLDLPRRESSRSGSGRWRAIAVDDADAATDEKALLHLLNAAQENRLPVLLTARSAPSRWGIALPDLDSRLRATPSVSIGRPDEEMLRILLLRLLVERQLAVAPPVIDWLLARLPRTAASMLAAARGLDEAALASGRRVTRALAATVLAGLLAWPVDADAGDEAAGTARLL